VTRARALLVAAPKHRAAARLAAAVAARATMSAASPQQELRPSSAINGRRASATPAPQAVRTSLSPSPNSHFKQLTLREAFKRSGSAPEMEKSAGRPGDGSTAALQPTHQTMSLPPLYPVMRQASSTDSASDTSAVATLDPALLNSLPAVRAAETVGSKAAPAPARVARGKGAPDSAVPTAAPPVGTVGPQYSTASLGAVRRSRRSTEVESILRTAPRKDGPRVGWTAPVKAVSLVPVRQDPRLVCTLGGRLLTPLSSISCAVSGQPPDGTPRDTVDAWDADHVKLPCSPMNIIVVPDGRRLRKWELIKRVLRTPITTVDELGVRDACFYGAPSALRAHGQRVLRFLSVALCDQAAILVFNPSYKNWWTFSILREFFTSIPLAQATALFNSTVDDAHSSGSPGRRFGRSSLARAPVLGLIFGCVQLPFMANLALRLPELFPRPIPLLKQDRAKSITITQEQVRSRKSEW